MQNKTINLGYLVVEYQQDVLDKSYPQLVQANYDKRRIGFLSEEAQDDTIFALGIVTGKQK